MALKNNPEHRSDAGFALVSVVVFVLLVAVSAAGFFALTSYESRSSAQRQASTEAFFLADGAVERARARFLEDRAWRDGWNGVEAGGGSYDLTVRDTVVVGLPGAVHLQARGYVDGVERDVDIVAQVPPAAFNLALYVSSDIEVNGNLCLEGPAHVGGDADFGRNDSHLACGTYTHSFRLTPPAVDIEPEAYPDATYYYVVAARQGNRYVGRVFDRYGEHLEDLAEDGMFDVLTYDSREDRFEWDFDSDSVIGKYFDRRDGVFSVEPGDLYVVVNFGEPGSTESDDDDDDDDDGRGRGRGRGDKGGGGAKSGDLAYSNVILDGGRNTNVRVTIINTRFVGVTDQHRLDPDYWEGGATVVKQLAMEPDGGLAIIAKDFGKEGGAGSEVGTEDHPALLYVTGDITDMNSNFTIRGSVIVLGDVECGGTVTITHDERFAESLPSYFYEGWSAGVSGTLNIVRWTDAAINP